MLHRLATVNITAKEPGVSLKGVSATISGNIAEIIIGINELFTIQKILLPYYQHTGTYVRLKKDSD